MAIKLGLACNCKIADEMYFDRKHYFYPDSPLGYQITQQNKPVCVGGYVSIPVDEGEREILLERIHMEADAGKSIHDQNDDYTLIDLNRAGMPLLELVTCQRGLLPETSYRKPSSGQALPSSICNINATIPVDPLEGVLRYSIQLIWIV